MNGKATLCAIALATVLAPTAEAVVNVQLNLRYDDPADETAGGSWELLAGSDNNSIAGIAVLIDNINDDAAAAGSTGFAVFKSQQVVSAIEAVTGHDDTGLVSGATDIGLGSGTTGNVVDDLFGPGSSPAIWENNALLALGTFDSTRPSFLTTFGTLAYGVNEFSGGDAVAATSGTLAVRGDSVDTDGLLLGDANRDGVIGGFDIATVLSNLNTPGGWDQGDFNSSGFVDNADLAILQGIPEPTSLAMAGIAIASCLGICRRS